ncbi:MAG: tRNA dihydrouridine synthase DusB [Nitrospirae bacterium]|nr:tRNA dihydrouridine synthase DusB [Nitrospirota bacterium]
MFIGNIEINGVSVLAPLAGITDLPFRLICREMGAALVYTEMISCEGLIRRQPATVDVCASVPEERPVSFQLFGGKPASMAEAARILSGQGADIVDINMGCPVKKVVRNGSGSALLKDLARAEEMIKRTVAASSVPVTVKIRTGWEKTDFVAVEFARMAEASGAAAVAVHGRYAKQGFSGHADWTSIARVKEAVGIPVMGNGDVLSAHDAKRMLDTTGCDLVMIGRGALGNPWIFREVEAYIATGVLPAPPTVTERGDMLLAHLNAVVARMRNKVVGVKLMRKHAAWYSKCMNGAAEFRRVVNHVETVEAFTEAVEGFFTAGATLRSHTGGCVEDGYYYVKTDPCVGPS